MTRVPSRERATRSTAQLHTLQYRFVHDTLCRLAPATAEGRPHRLWNTVLEARASKTTTLHVRSEQSPVSGANLAESAQAPLDLQAGFWPASPGISHTPSMRSLIVARFHATVASGCWNSCSALHSAAPRSLHN